MLLQTSSGNLIFTLFLFCLFMLFMVIFAIVFYVTKKQLIHKIKQLTEEKNALLARLSGIE